MIVQISTVFIEFSSAFQGVSGVFYYLFQGFSAAFHTRYMDLKMGSMRLWYFKAFKAALQGVPRGIEGLRGILKGIRGFEERFNSMNPRDPPEPL